jgi:hypothetical protein
LSWERSAIGFLGIAAIVLFRHNGPLAEGRTLLAVLSILLALLTFRIAHVRGPRSMTQRAGAGNPEVSSPISAVRLVGWSTAFLAAVIVVFLALAV